MHSLGKASARIKNSWQRLLLASGWIMQWGPGSQNPSPATAAHNPGAHLGCLGPYGFITHTFSMLPILWASPPVKSYPAVFLKVGPQVTGEPRCRIYYVVVTQDPGQVSISYPPRIQGDRSRYGLNHPHHPTPGSCCDLCHLACNTFASPWPQHQHQHNLGKTNIPELKTQTATKQRCWFWITANTFTTHIYPCQIYVRSSKPADCRNASFLPVLNGLVATGRPAPRYPCLRQFPGPNGRQLVWVMDPLDHNWLTQNSLPKNYIRI